MTKKKVKKKKAKKPLSDEERVRKNYRHRKKDGD